METRSQKESTSIRERISIRDTAKESTMVRVRKATTGTTREARAKASIGITMNDENSNINTYPLNNFQMSFTINDLNHSLFY
jgi:hypothetical protein